MAREVFSQIVEMDDQARSLDDGQEYQPASREVCIADKTVEFHDFATTINTEWWGTFTRQNDGTYKRNPE
jgi:hypothetical protein